MGDFIARSRVLVQNLKKNTHNDSFHFLNPSPVIQFILTRDVNNPVAALQNFSFLQNAGMFLNSSATVSFLTRIIFYEVTTILHKLNQL
jgi:hypothetical protein